MLPSRSSALSPSARRAAVAVAAAAAGQPRGARPATLANGLLVLERAGCSRQQLRRGGTRSFAPTNAAAVPAPLSAAAGGDRRAAVVRPFRVVATTTTAISTCTTATTTTITTANRSFSSYAFANKKDSATPWSGPQSTVPRIDLTDDPALSNLTPIKIADLICRVPIGELNPVDVTRGLIRVVKDCCRLQSWEGMEGAARLLQRLCREKRHVNQTLLAERALGTASSGRGYDNAEPLIINQLPFHILTFGWAKLAGKGRANAKKCPDKAKEVLDWMKKEDEADGEVWEALGLGGDDWENGDEFEGEEGGWDEEEEEEEAGEAVEYEGENGDRQGEGYDFDDKRSGTSSRQPNRRKKRRRPSCRPTVSSYNTLLTAYVNASPHDPRDAAVAAERTLDVMSSLRSETGWHTGPNTRSYGLVVAAFAKSSGDGRAGIGAERVLNRMHAEHEAELARYRDQVGTPYDLANPLNNVRQIVTPDVRAVSGAIAAYANSNARNSAAEAERVLLDSVRRQQQAGGHIRLVDGRAFTAAIRAWGAAAGKRGNPKARVEAAERAEALLELMIELAAAEEEEEEADLEVFKAPATGEMEREEEWGGGDNEDDGDDDDDVSANDNGDGTHEERTESAKRRTSTGSPSSSSSSSLAPSTATHNAVLDAWARSDTREAAPRAEALLDRMIDSATAAAATTAATGDKVIASATARPDNRSFNIVVNAWARARHDPDAPLKAEAVLERMYDLYHGGGEFGEEEEVRPTNQTYTAVINAWARSGGGAAAAAGTIPGEGDGEGGDSSEGSVSDEGEVNGRPRRTTRSKAANARRVLDAMLGKLKAGEEDMKPNVMAYTAVLNAAAHEEEGGRGPGGGGSENVNNAKDGDGLPLHAPDDDDPYAIAQRTYREITDDAHDVGVAPDHLTYATMIKAIGAHTDAASDERRTDIERVFDDACNAGQVSAVVVRELRAACPSVDLVERLLGSRKLARELGSIDELPPEWTGKIRGDVRLRKVDVRGDGSRGAATRRSGGGRGSGREARGRRGRGGERGQVKQEKR